MFQTARTTVRLGVGKAVVKINRNGPAEISVGLVTFVATCGVCCCQSKGVVQCRGDLLSMLLYEGVAQCRGDLWSVLLSV